MCMTFVNYTAVGLNIVNLPAIKMVIEFDCYSVYGKIARIVEISNCFLLDVGDDQKLALA